MAMIEIGGQLFPDDCPEKCPGRIMGYGQGDLCHRCPIFNCTGVFRLLPPEHYRPEWAEAWKKWFDTGMEGLPELYFEVEK